MYCMFIFFSRIVVVEVPDLLSSIDYRALTPDANEKRPDRVIQPSKSSAQCTKTRSEWHR